MVSARSTYLVIFVPIGTPHWRVRGSPYLSITDASVEGHGHAIDDLITSIAAIAALDIMSCDVVLRWLRRS